MKKDRLKEIEKESNQASKIIAITIAFLLFISALIIGYAIFKLIT